VKHWVSHQASKAGRARRPQHERLEADRRGGPGHGEEVGVEDDARGVGLLLLVREHRLEDAPEDRRLLRLHGGVHGVQDADDVQGRGDGGGDTVGHGTNRNSGRRPGSGGALKRVWSTVTVSPRAWSASASCSIGLMWPWNGNGNTRTRRGRRDVVLPPASPPVRASWTPAIAVDRIVTASSTGTSTRSTQGLKTECSCCLCLICRPDQSCHQEMIQLLRMSYLCVLTSETWLVLHFMSGVRFFFVLHPSKI